MPYFIYILECRDKSLYTGYTNNLEKRLKAHNELKSGAKYTKSRRPVKLKYFEEYESLSKALKREIEIQGLTRQEKIKLINNANIHK
jgi:putative endonuclease